MIEARRSTGMRTQPGRRRRTPSRPWMLIGAALAVGGVAALALPRVPPLAPAAGPSAVGAPAATTTVPTSAVTATVTAPPPPPAVSYPEQGSRTYTIVPGDGPVIGNAGELYRYQVAIETDIVNLDGS